MVCRGGRRQGNFEGLEDYIGYGCLNDFAGVAAVFADFACLDFFVDVGFGDPIAVQHLLVALYPAKFAGVLGLRLTMCGVQTSRVCLGRRDDTFRYVTAAAGVQKDEWSCPLTPSDLQLSFIIKNYSRIVPLWQSNQF